MSEVTEHQQLLSRTARVKLFKLDLTPIGLSDVYYFSPTGECYFDGQKYSNFPVSVSEVERNVTGEMVSPKLMLPNIGRFSSKLAKDNDDIIGAELTRTVTYERFLDGRPTSDPDAIQSIDTFIIEQKLNGNRAFWEWELRVIGDTADRGFPGRQAQRQVCPFVYRRWDADAEEFVAGRRLPCPYTDTDNMFTITNEPTEDPALDACDHLVSGGCKARTPGWPSGVLGFGGFPGMSRMRV